MADSSLQKFLTMVGDSDTRLGKPILFWVMLPILAPDGNEMLSLLCHSAVIPGYTIMSSPSKIYGLPLEMPYELAFDPVKLTFYADAVHDFPQLFHGMRDFIIDRSSFSPNYRRGPTGYELPTADIYIIDYSIRDTTKTSKPEISEKIVATYRLNNVFIKSVASMDLAWHEVNKIQEISIDLSYEQMTIYKGEPRAAAGITSESPAPSVSTETDTFPEYVPGNDGTVNTNTGSPALIQNNNVVAGSKQTGNLSGGSQPGYNVNNVYNNAPTLAQGAIVAQTMLSQVSGGPQLFVDSAGMGKAYSAAAQGAPWDQGKALVSILGKKLPIMYPVDKSNPVNGVRIDPGSTDGAGYKPPTMPMNFDSLAAINPGAAKGFKTSAFPASWGPATGPSSDIMNPNSLENAHPG